MLSQPFTVDSMKLLLRSDDSQQYKYYIEVSLDEEHWTRVVDRTDDFSSSWQTCSFDPCAVLYIRIVGTAERRAR